MSEKPIPRAALNTPQDELSPAESVKRKGFISWLVVGWVAFASATGTFLAMIVRFLFPNVLFEPPP